MHLGDPALAGSANSVEKLAACRCRREVDGDEAVREALGELAIEFEGAEAMRAHSNPEEVAHLLATLEVRGHFDGFSEREKLSTRPLDADRCRRPHVLSYR